MKTSGTELNVNTASLPLQDVIVNVPREQWLATTPPQADWQEDIERGRVLFFPRLRFELTVDERRFLSPAFSDERRKSIYIRADRPGIFGTQATPSDCDALMRLLKRYEQQSMGLLASLFSAYAASMRSAGTSYRPRPTGIGHEPLSWRKDDTRLHVDAFPSNPTNGLRILRVFSNIGIGPRVWRVGESFEAMSAYFFPGLRAPWPASRGLMHRLGITKRKRSLYDHYMVQLHDHAKADLRYQSECSQIKFEFPPGSSWICFSDQVMHAAMSGQYMLEQTVHVPNEALVFAQHSPLRILEKMMQRPLV